MGRSTPQSPSLAPPWGGAATGRGAGAVSPGLGTSEVSIGGGGSFLFGQELVFGVVKGVDVGGGGAAVAAPSPVSAAAPSIPAVSVVAASERVRWRWGLREARVFIDMQFMRRAGVVPRPSGHSNP